LEDDVKKIALLALLTIAAAVAPAGAANAPAKPKPTHPPQASTSAASAVGQTAATLQGSVNPRGLPTTYRFDYGPTSAYGLATAPVSAGSGTTAKAVAARVTGLAPGTTYHFRIEASSSAGTTSGKDARFTTLPRLTIAATPARIVFGSATKITGQLQSASNAGKVIELQANPYPYSGFVTVATATTDSLGRYTFAGQRPGVNTRYRTVTAKAPSATSATVSVGVRIRLTRKASDTTPAKGQSVTFSGFACPAHVNGLVALQRRTSTGQWVTVARTHLVQAAASATCANRSRYKLTINVSHNRTFRTLAARDADHLKGISASIAIRVH
jgi:hypothetical protein